MPICQWFFPLYSSYLPGLHSPQKTLAGSKNQSIMKKSRTRAVASAQEAGWTPPSWTWAVSSLTARRLSPPGMTLPACARWQLPALHWWKSWPRTRWPSSRWRSTCWRLTKHLATGGRERQTWGSTESGSGRPVCHQLRTLSGFLRILRTSFQTTVW